MKKPTFSLVRFRHRQRAVAFAALAALVAASSALSGCATSGATDSERRSDENWSIIPGSSPVLPVSALNAGSQFVAAWIDADVSGPNVAFEVSQISFDATADGAVAFHQMAPGGRAETWGQIRAAILAHGGEGPIGVFFTAGGKPVLIEGSEPDAPMRNFVRLFMTGLDEAGIDFVLLVPSSFSPTDRGTNSDAAEPLSPDAPWEF